MIKVELYTGSEGSEKEGIEAHAYSFTSGRMEGVVWGGAVVTLGCVDEMALIRTELGGAVGILLVLYAIQVQRCPSSLPVTICIDNAEVLDRARTREVGDNINKHRVLDYDLWQAMNIIQALICTPLTCKKLTLTLMVKCTRRGYHPNVTSTPYG